MKQSPHKCGRRLSSATLQSPAVKSSWTMTTVLTVMQFTMQLAGRQNSSKRAFEKAGDDEEQFAHPQVSRFSTEFCSFAHNCPDLLLPNQKCTARIAPKRSLCGSLLSLTQNMTKYVKKIEKNKMQKYGHHFIPLGFESLV